MAPLALLSTYDKTGLVDLARALVEEFGFQLVSSGGTAKAIAAAGLAVTEVADYTGSPEILGGRVKTLHPRIHGGILGRRDLPQDCQEMEQNAITPIDLVVVNLYPFEQTIYQPDVTLETAIEKNRHRRADPVARGGEKPCLLHRSLRSRPVRTLLATVARGQR